MTAIPIIEQLEFHKTFLESRGRSVAAVVTNWAGWTDIVGQVQPTETGSTILGLPVFVDTFDTEARPWIRVVESARPPTENP